MIKFGIIASVLVLLIAVMYTMVDINNIGLKVLSWIKSITGNSVPINQMDTSTSHDISHDIWNELLMQNVKETGEVNYKGFISEKDNFENYSIIRPANIYGPYDNFTEKIQW